MSCWLAPPPPPPPQREPPAWQQWKGGRGGSESGWWPPDVGDSRAACPCSPSPPPPLPQVRTDMTGGAGLIDKEVRLFCWSASRMAFDRLTGNSNH